MAGWNGAGSFSISFPDFVAGTTIVSTQVDTNNSDFVTGLMHCLTVNGETVPTANLPMATFKHTGVGNASARDQYAAAGQVQDSAFHWVNAAGVTGTADAILLAPSPAITAYAEGQVFRFRAEATSTSATPTVNISSVGAKTIQKDGGALAVGDIVNGRWYEIIYDGTNFQLSNWTHAAASSAIPGAASTSASGIIELATQAEVDTGTDAVRAVTPSTLTGWTPGVGSVTLDPTADEVLIRDASASNVLKRASLAPALPVLGTEAATTSGSTVDFTGIPAYVKRIVIHFVGVSTNGTSAICVQLGDSGGIETSGYTARGAAIANAAAVAVVAQTTGFPIHNASTAADNYTGTMTITLENASTFQWVATYMGVTSNATAAMNFGSGVKALSAALTQIRITSIGGDTFDAGSVNILYD